MYKCVSYVYVTIKKTTKYLNISISHLFTSRAWVLLLNLGSQRTTSLYALKSKLDNLLRYPYNWRVVKIEYRSPSIYNEGKLKFNNFELKTNEDLRFKSYVEYILLLRKKSLIEVNTTVAISIDDILKDAETSSIISSSWSVILNFMLTKIYIMLYILCMWYQIFMLIWVFFFSCMKLLMFTNNKIYSEFYNPKNLTARFFVLAWNLF